MGQKSKILATFGLLLFITQWLEVISFTFEQGSEDDSFVDSNTDAPNIDLYNDSYFSSNELSEPFVNDFSDEEFNNEEEPDHEWDLLIFTQQWPVTTCYHFREDDHAHQCQLPAKKEFWTIHGIWPTKLGHIGPSFCNKSANFDLDQIKQILQNLETYWPTVDSQQQLGIFWAHEWLKHGTCAATLEELNNELKYFRKGLAWRDEFLISNMLGSAGIHPDSNNTVVALQAALIKTLGKNPSIHCLYDKKHDMSYLEEIRICFNKQLDLVDCDGVPGDAVSVNYPGGTVITNCHISKPIHYPSNVPPLLRKQEEKWKFPVVNTYKLLQFIMWFTL